MYLGAVLNAVDLEVHQILIDDIDGVPAGLTNRGWTSTSVARTVTVFDLTWSHDACNKMAHAQTGVEGDNSYIGLIANFDGESGAAELLNRICFRLHPQLLAAGYTPRVREDSSSNVWSDGQTALELSLLRPMRHDIHNPTSSAIRCATAQELPRVITSRG